MKETKFRGQILNGTRKGEWVYGYYAYILGDHLIIDKYNNQYIVDPNTVGQYTGLEDKNNNEIYQGDIIRITRDEENYGPTSYGGYAEVTSEVCGYSFKCFSPSLKDIEENPLDDDGNYRAWDSTSLWHIDDDNGKNIEAIGSIHDNPNLLTE